LAESDHALSANAILFSPDNDKSARTLLPACEFKLDVADHLEIEVQARTPGS
jgi:hypothetical protein